MRTSRKNSLNASFQIIQVIITLMTNSFCSCFCRNGMNQCSLFSCTKCCFLILFYFLFVFFTNNYGKSSITDGEQKLPFDRKLWKVSLTVRKKFLFLFFNLMIWYLQMIEYFMKFLSQDYHRCTSLSNCLIMWWYFITLKSI